MSKHGGGFFVAGAAGGGGAGSVTSNEASAISAQAASAINVVSNAVSVVSQAVSALSQQNSVEHAALSVRVDTQSQGISVLSQAISVVSQQVSANSNSLANLSVRTSLAGASVKGLQSVLNAISNRISIEAPVGGGGGSVTSTEVSAVSAQAASAINVVSNQVSVLSVQAALIDGTDTEQIWEKVFPGTNTSILLLADGKAIEVSAVISVTSTEVSAVSAQAASAINVVSNAVSIVSTAASNALSVANAASNAASIVSQAVSVLSQAVSVLSQAVSVISQSNSVLSQAVSVLSQAVSVLSQNVSVLSNLVCGPVLRVLSTIQTISATILTNISGFSVSVVAAGVYRLDAMLMINRGAAAQPYGYGMTFPAMKYTRGNVFEGTSVVQTDPTILGQVAHHAIWEGDSASGSILLSTVSAALLSTIIMYAGLFKVSTTGTLQLQALGSAGAAALQIVDGSYMQVFRLA